MEECKNGQFASSKIVGFAEWDGLFHVDTCTGIGMSAGHWGKVKRNRKLNKRVDGIKRPNRLRREENGEKRTGLISRPSLYVRVVLWYKLAEKEPSEKSETTSLPQYCSPHALNLRAAGYVRSLASVCLVKRKNRTAVLAYVVLRIAGRVYFSKEQRTTQNRKQNHFWPDFLVS
jgi:hypothetical protein